MARAIDRLDDRFQDVRKRDMDLKADMVGAWRKRNASEDIHHEKLESSISEIKKKKITEVKEVASNCAELIDAKLYVLKEFLNGMVMRQKGIFSFLEE